MSVEELIVSRKLALASKEPGRLEPKEKIQVKDSDTVSIDSQFSAGFADHLNKVMDSVGVSHDLHKTIMCFLLQNSWTTAPVWHLAVIVLIKIMEFVEMIIELNGAQKRALVLSLVSEVTEYVFDIRDLSTLIEVIIATTRGQYALNQKSYCCVL